MSFTIIKELDRDEKGIVELIEDSGERQFVRRRMHGIVEVYRELKMFPHRFLPAIISVEYDNDTTIVIEEYINAGGNISILREEGEKITAFCELCEVLDFIHSQGIIHRDIKPSNILVADDGHIRLIDFDAARIYKENSAGDTQYLGTKGYAAPEQFGFSQTGYTADIYALGVTMKTVLGSLANKARYKSIIRKCTEFDPENRYQRAIDVKRSLEFSGLRSVGLFFSAAVTVCIFIAIIAMFNLSGNNVSDYISDSTYLMQSTYATHEDSTQKDIAQTTSKEYVLNSELQGTWIPVYELESFDTEIIQSWLDEKADVFTHTDSLWIEHIACYDGGKFIASSGFQSVYGHWTDKGLTFELDGVTEEMDYKIAEKNGETYLFLENIMNPYLNGAPENCLVAKKKTEESVSPDENAKIPLYETNVISDYGNGKHLYGDSLIEEYSFVTDKNLTGEWIAVDHINGYDPYWIYDKNKDTSSLWYKKAVFCNDGTCTFYTGDDMKAQDEIWTYGVIITDQTVNGYMINCINGENFLFIEDKTEAYRSNDYWGYDYYIFKQTEKSIADS